MFMTVVLSAGKALEESRKIIPPILMRGCVVGNDEQGAQVAVLVV
jgi:hypothetical protein